MARKRDEGLVWYRTWSAFRTPTLKVGARMDECAARRGTVRETKAGPAGTVAELAGAWK